MGHLAAEKLVHKQTTTKQRGKLRATSRQLATAPQRRGTFWLDNAVCWIPHAHVEGAPWVPLSVQVASLLRWIAAATCELRERLELPHGICTLPLPRST